MASVWGELKRRNVVRVTIAYAIVAWLLVNRAAVLPTGGKMAALGTQRTFSIILAQGPLWVLSGPFD